MRKLTGKRQLLNDLKADTYNWMFVFGEKDYGNTPPLEFTRADVARVFAMWDNDDQEWSGWVVGQLKDGRYFHASGGCDYTGWDCQAYNRGSTYETQDEFIREVGDEVRSALGVGLSGLGSEVLP